MSDNNSKNDIDKHIRVLKEKLYKFLSKEKPADVLIIKSHLICEYYLNQILILEGRCAAKELTELTFYQKNQKAFDQSNEQQKILFDSLIVINKLRNKVGHELEYSLAESDVDSLGFILGKNYILEKYNFEILPELLRNTLIIIVIDLALAFFDMVDHKKNQT